MSANNVAAAAAKLEQTAQERGGPYEQPEAYRGSCARTMFDRPGAQDGTVTILIPENEIGGLSLNGFVRIPSIHPRTGRLEAEYLGVVASGPFAEPDALSATAPTLLVSAAHGAVLTPKYHGIAHVEVFSERVGGTLIPPLRRPCPNSPVFLLGEVDVRGVLGLDVPAADRPIRLGLMDGAHQLAINVPAAKKSVLYKHMAILGTTGGGKSTTVSGTVGSLAGEGNAVVLFDIEGEYTTMNEPANAPSMVAALQRRGLAPQGADDTCVYVLADRQPANPNHPNIRYFKIAFSDLSPYILKEMLDLSEPQERRLIDAFESCRVLMEKLKIFPANPQENQQATEIDELESGWPRMTLLMMIDVVSAVIHSIKKTTADYRPRSPEFRGHDGDMFVVLNQRNLENDARSWLAIAKRLWRMHRSGVFGTDPCELINCQEMLKAGRISIVDLSDMDAPYLRNLVIAQMLRMLQLQQDDLYRQFEAAQREGRAVGAPARANIFIEEAHEFLSAQRIKQMPNLFDQVARIARRGRKRYLGLVFVTQLPSHLPDEVFGLINNWILHKLTDTNVIQRLRKVVPMITDTAWASLPNLAPGQAICSFTHLTRPISVAIDPSPCRLRMVD